MFTRWHIELIGVAASDLAWLLKVDVTALKGALLAIHELFRFAGTCLIALMHVNLRTSPHMVSCNNLLIEWNLHSCCDLSCGSVELVTQNLIVVDQSRTRYCCILSMI